MSSHARGKELIPLLSFSHQKKQPNLSISSTTKMNKKNPDQKSDMSSSSSSPKKQTLFISSLIILWYTSNIGVLLLNKFLLSNYGFKFPIFLTMCHMSACAILSYVSIVFLKLVPLQYLKSRSQFLKVATLSIVFCASVVGGNISLRYLPVSFNQAVGATTPFFTALFAYIMTFKREAWVTYGALVPVVTGVVIASGGEPGFHWLDSLCALVLLQQELLNLFFKASYFLPRERLNSMNLMLYMSPIAVIALLPVTIFMEPDVMSVTLTLGRQHKYMYILLLVNSVMAYSANLLNFLVTKHTSALTLQVLGNAKGAVAVVISILLFRNPVTVMGIGGYSITVLGVVAYGETKRRFR
ncbi:putative sugar phosphate/phosphate translocator [Arabidopsis thaliana]